MSGTRSKTSGKRSDGALSNLCTFRDDDDSFDSEGGDYDDTIEELKDVDPEAMKPDASLLISEDKRETSSCCSS